MKVAVVGGGITGLATAWFLRRAGLEVALYEAGERLGGKIRTDRFGGVPVEAGPDTFLARVPWAVDLCTELGLAADLVAPATSRAYVWTRGRLRPLPEGTVLGVPTRLGQLRGFVSAPGMARAALDLVLPRSRWGPDPSVAEVVGRRLGREVVDRLVEPLLGGIHAGRADRLSLKSVAPQVGVEGRSLMRSLRRRRPSPEGPVFLGLRGGLGRLVERLVESLPDVEIHLGTPVSALEDLDADAVVVTVPAYAAAKLLPQVAGELQAIDYASVVTATLAYPRGDLDLEGSGFLVPRVEGRLLTACTWTSAKWASPHGQLLLRASAGRIGDDRALELDDAALVQRLHADLAEAMGLRAEPGAWLVNRWPRSFPQYDVGHDARVDRIERALPARVLVAGAAYRGVGIASCIRQAGDAASRVAALSHRSR